MAISLKAIQQNYQNIINTANDPTHEYFNMGVFNEYTPNNTQARPLRFNQTKQFNVVDKSDDYYLSIIRWNLQSNLPVLIPDIQIKDKPELFTNLTDYELALLYTSETTETVQNTFGLCSASGNNYNGEFQNAEYGFDKQIKINFPPDNSNSIDYDNYNNGLSSNGSTNGSIYIISNGVMKVFDKVSSAVIYTLTPSVGDTYKFICTNKTLGNFYIGITNNTDNTIYYKEYTRASANTWTAGGSYTSISNKNKVAGISLIGTTLYEFSYTQSLPDLVFGNSTVDAQVYNVNNNQQYTIYPTKSSIIMTESALAYGIGDDGFTYYINYPVLNPPTAWLGPANNSTVLKAGCLWSSYNANDLYSMGTTNAYNVWNFKNGPNTINYNNDWTSVGEIDINLPTVSAISIDKQYTTNKLVAVGSDNNLYISNDPVAPIEYIYSSGDPDYPDYNYGLSMWNQSTGAQNTYEIHNFNNLFGNHTQLFKHQNRLFVPIYQVGTTNVNLTIFSIKDFSILTTYTNFSTVGVNALCNLPIATKFAYVDDNNNIIICNISTAAVLETFTYFSSNPTGPTPMQMYELDSTHFVVCCGNNQVYIFKYGITTPVLIITTPTNCADVCVSTSDVSNGANSLFVLCGPNVVYDIYRGTTIYKYTFTNNTYTATNPPSLIYQQTGANYYVSYIDYQQDEQALMFITSIDNSNKILNTLFLAQNYNLINNVSCPLTLGNGEQLYYPTKQNFYLCQSTMSTHRWTQITSNVSVKAVSVSLSNQNNLYCLGSANSRLYGGEIIGNNITLSLYEHITKTYNYLSNSPLGSIDIQNYISEWTSTGSPSNINIFDEGSTASTTQNRPSFMTNGTNLYALYDLFNNQTKLNLINPSTLASTSSVVVNNNILNGLVGLDENNNILVSNKVNSISRLQVFNPTTLISLFDNLDPLADYNSSTMCIYPYVKTITTTHYNLASDGCVNLLFIPETINTNYESLLNYPMTKEELFGNSYFYIKYVDTLCRMINNAILEAFKTISGASWTHLPYFQWNSVEGKLIYNQPTSVPTGTSAPANAKWFVSINQPLYNLLSTFRFKFFAQNAGNGSIYPEDIDCRYLLDTNILYDGTTQEAGEYASYIQQISSVQTWSPIQSFVFSSTIIPIEPQLTGQPQNINNIDPTTTGNIYKQQALTKVLTDFIVPLTSGVEQTNQVVYYVPTGEYRLVDLLGHNNLNQLTLDVFWKDKYGVLHPLTIDAGSSSDLLCLLRKKSYNSKF